MVKYGTRPSGDFGFWYKVIFCYGKICNCHICKYNCKKLYCTRRDSNSGPLVYETSALPIELKGIPSSRVSIKRLVCTNTCDIFPLHEESRPRDLRFSRTFASLTRNIFATQRNTESTLGAIVTYANTIVKNCIAPAGIRTRVLWFTKPVLYRLS